MDGWVGGWVVIFYPLQSKPYFKGIFIYILISIVNGCQNSFIAEKNERKKEYLYFFQGFPKFQLLASSLWKIDVY